MRRGAGTEGSQLRHFLADSEGRATDSGSPPASRRAAPQRHATFRRAVPPCSRRCRGMSSHIAKKGEHSGRILIVVTRFPDSGSLFACIVQFIRAIRNDPFAMPGKGIAAASGSMKSNRWGRIAIPRQPSAGDWGLKLVTATAGNPGSRAPMSLAAPLWEPEGPPGSGQTPGPAPRVHACPR